MVSSAIYRYFPSRDDLLTALIIDGYNALGEAVEQADAACAREDYLGRWLAICHGARDWAVAHPHEYALLYGSPVPGYQAPQDTVPAALRDTVVMGALVSQAYDAGVLLPVPDSPSTPAALSEDAAAVRAIIPGVPDEVIFRSIAAWTGMFGWLSFELFGQFNNTINDLRGSFDHTMRLNARQLGLPA